MKNTFKIFIALISVSVSAQEFNLPISNQYISDNTYQMSAAYAGIGDCWQARATGFQQWLGVKNAPNTQSLSLDGRIRDNSGVGGVLYSDSNGFTSQRGIMASYAHHLTISDYNKQYLSFGLTYKFSQFGIETSAFNDGTLISPDNKSVLDNNFDVSVLYRINDFFFNANAINILTKDIRFFNAAEPEKIRSYYIYSGFLIKNEMKQLQYEPSLLYRNFESDDRSTMDFNFKLRKYNYENYYWIGVTLKTIIDQTFKPVFLSPMVGLKKNQFYVAYGYQLSVNESASFSNLGSHIITVGYDFGCKKSFCGCTY
jgi:type IX secretion system PorP/SprF family membrane protein